MHSVCGSGPSATCLPASRTVTLRHANLLHLHPVSASLQKCACWLKCFINSAILFRFLLLFDVFRQIQHNNSMLFVLHLSLWPRSDGPRCMSVHWWLNNPCWSTTGLCRVSWYVNVPASLYLTWPSLFSRSGQQVLGSCILAQLSLEASPGCRVYVGHRERKRTQSNTPALQCEMLPNARKNSDLSRHHDKAPGPTEEQLDIDTQVH